MSAATCDRCHKRLPVTITADGFGPVAHRHCASCGHHQNPLPCPFCQSPAEVRIIGTPGLAVICSDCHAQGPAVDAYDDKDGRTKAIWEWNTRLPQDSMSSVQAITLFTEIVAALTRLDGKVDRVVETIKTPPKAETPRDERCRHAVCGRPLRGWSGNMPVMKPWEHHPECPIRLRWAADTEPEPRR